MPSTESLEVGLGKPAQLGTQINLETMRDDLDSCHLQTPATSLESASSFFSRGHSFDQHCRCWQIMNQSYGIGIAALTALNKSLVLQTPDSHKICYDSAPMGLEGFFRSTFVCGYHIQSSCHCQVSHLPVGRSTINVRPGLDGLLKKA